MVNLTTKNGEREFVVMEEERSFFLNFIWLKIRRDQERFTQK